MRHLKYKLATPTENITNIQHNPLIDAARSVASSIEPASLGFAGKCIITKRMLHVGLHRKPNNKNNKKIDFMVWHLRESEFAYEIK